MFPIEMKLSISQEVENVNGLAALRKWKNDCKTSLCSEHQAQMILMVELYLHQEELNHLLLCPSE